MHVQIVLVDTPWLHNVWEIFLFFIKFKFLWKNSVSEKIKAHLPQHPQYITTVTQPSPFWFFSKILLAPLSFKKEGRDYAFHMRDYKGETVKLLPFYMTDLLFTELLNLNIWRKLNNRMENDIPNIQNYLHISDPNFLPSYFWISSHRHQFHHKFSDTLRSIFADCFWRTFFVAHKKCIFLNMSANRVLKD